MGRVQTTLRDAWRSGNEGMGRGRRGSGRARSHLRAGGKTRSGMRSAKASTSRQAGAVHTAHAQNGGCSRGLCWNFLDPLVVLEGQGVLESRRSGRDEQDYGSEGDIPGTQVGGYLPIGMAVFPHFN